MKLNLLSLAFLSAAAAASADPSTKDALLEEVRNKMLVNRRRHHSRMLQLTDECIAATDELAYSDAYFNAVQAATEACPQATTQSGNDMTVDYSVCNPEFSAALEEACTAAGGTTVSGVALNMDCKAEGESMSVSMAAVPECLDASCDVSQWEGHKDQLLAEQAAEMESMLAMMGMECTISGAGKLGAGVLAFALASAALFF